MRKSIGMTLGLTISVFTANASADETVATVVDPMPARETARVMPQKGLAIGLGHGLELTTNLVPWFLLSPNLSVRAELLHRKASGLTLTTEFGLGVPSGAMYMLQGYLFPSNTVSGEGPPFLLQQHAGVWLSGGLRGVWTVHADVSGVLIGDQTKVAPLDSFVPLNLWFGPATAGSRWHLGGTYDLPFTTWLRGRAGFHLYALGKATTIERSVAYVGAEAALEVRLGRRMRVALGAQWYNYDNGQTVVEQNDAGRFQRVNVRSNDIYPTLDVVYYSP
jgi:hypothetical protein